MSLRCPIIVALLLGTFAPDDLAQVLESDPRFARDPREDVPDPRGTQDPRDLDLSDEERLARLEGQELFDALYDAGDERALVLAMQESPWDLLEYIDAHCTRWMRLVEGDEAMAESEAAALLREKARELARLADQGIGDTRFSIYVANILGWDQQEQVLFREGRALYEEGEALVKAAASAPELLRALTPLQRSFEHARPLGDMLGQAMSLVMIGQVQLANGLAEARDTMHEAVRIGLEIRDLDAVWTGLSVIFTTSAERGDYEAAQQALREQYQLSLEVGDEDTADAVLQRIVEFETLRQQEARWPAPEPLPGPGPESEG